MIFKVSYFILLDIFLFIFRWYKTAGIIATIMRGRDVEVRIDMIMAETDDDWCAECCCCIESAKSSHEYNKEESHHKIRPTSFLQFGIFFSFFFFLKINLV